MIRIIDDFCPEIDTVLASAKAPGIGTWMPNRGEIGKTAYDGMGFVGAMAPMHAALMRVVGVMVPNQSFFRCTNEDAKQRAYIHSDRDNGAHTCVVYLSDHEETYGTAFYRHDPTGLERMPSMVDMHGKPEFDGLKRDMLTREHFTQTDFVSGRKNRAVIADAPLFHSRIPETGCGHDESDGRWVWVCHFYVIGPDGRFC